MSLQRKHLQVRAFDLAARFSNWLLALPDRLLPPPVRLLRIGTAFWQSRALHTAAQLDIASVLGDGALTLGDLAAQVHADREALHRLLRMLAGMGVFERGRDGLYRNSASSHYLRADHPGSVRAMVCMHNSPEMSRPWFEQLTPGLRTGRAPFELVHGQPLFDWMDGQPAFEALFGAAMDSVESLSGDSFATAFAWDRFTRVIDIGGSKGAKSLAILRHHAHLRAQVLDRPQAIAGAAAYWRGRVADDVLNRLRFEPGDAFVSVPAARDAGDVYLLSAVLHSFDDAACVRLLGNVAAAAAPAGARIVVFELVLDEAGTDFMPASFDMQMFVGGGGRERTRAEWDHLFAAAGVRCEARVRLASFGAIQVLCSV